MKIADTLVRDKLPQKKTVVGESPMVKNLRIVGNSSVVYSSVAVLLRAIKGMQKVTFSLAGYPTSGLGFKNNHNF